MDTELIYEMWRLEDMMLLFASLCLYFFPLVFGLLANDDPLDFKTVFLDIYAKKCHYSIQTLRLPGRKLANHR